MNITLIRAFRILNRDNDNLLNSLYNIGRVLTFVDLRKVEVHIPKKTRTLIDVGCGSGMVSLYLHLRNRKRKIYGYDLNEYRIKNLKQSVKKNKIKNLYFDVKDLVRDRNIPKTDVYLLMDLLHHVSKDVQVELLKSIYKQMGKNNTLIIKEINRNFSYKHLITLLLDFIITKGDKMYYRSTKKWIELLEKIGFQVEAHRVFSLFYPHIVLVCKKSSSK